MIGHGKLADIIFGVQYPLPRDLQGDRRGWRGILRAGAAGARHQRMENQSQQQQPGLVLGRGGCPIAPPKQGTMCGMTAPSNRPIVFFANASCSSYQDNLGYPCVITRMREFSKTHLDGTIMVGYMDGGVKTFANLAS